MLRRAALALCLCPLPAFAQDTDRGYLTAFLEDNLSSAGRQVTITGFEGALSSQAHMAEITIADDEGVWLTLRDVVIDWNRADLLSGAVSVNELSAAKIIVARLPHRTDASLPAPEAGSFALPDLPVSVDIAQLSADQILLAAPVLGEPVEGQFAAQLKLENGEGYVDLLLQRQDRGPEGKIALTASYSNSESALALDLTLQEARGGLVAQRLNLPGAPSVDLKIGGKGPFSDFLAKIDLSTDGENRLGGSVQTRSLPEGVGFVADLSGNLAPLFLPEYADFFGDSVALRAGGTAFADGRIALPELTVTARAINLQGNMDLGAKGRLAGFHLTGQIANPNGGPVVLPLASSQPVQLETANLTVAYDRAQGEGWSAQVQVSGFDQGRAHAENLTLSGSGRIRKDFIGATLRLAANGLGFGNPALAAAVGSNISGTAVLTYSAADTGLAIPRLQLFGDSYDVNIMAAHVAGLAQGFEVSGKIAAEITDLSRMAGFIGQPVSGKAAVQIMGRLGPLTGGFDISATLDGQDIDFGTPLLQGLLRGKSNLSTELARDENGLHLRFAKVIANGMNAEAQGEISSTDSDLKADLRLDDLSVMRGFGGRMQASARITGPLADAQIDADAKAADLRFASAELTRLLHGESHLSARFALKDGALRVQSASLQGAEVTGVATNAGQGFDVSAQVRNLAVLLPEFPGPLSVSGRIENGLAGAELDLMGKGPGGIDARLGGHLAGGQSDLSIRGRAQAALVNAFITPRALSGDLGFDLRLAGPLQISSLSGQMTLERGKFSEPSLPYGFRDISARADLAAGQARIAAKLPLTTSGTVSVSGTIGLAEPYQAGLEIGLAGLGLRDADFYDTRLQGALRLQGPLLGVPLLSGRVDVQETELRLASTGLTGAAGLPDLRHSHEPASVKVTRARAGVLQNTNRSARQAKGDLALDIAINAPNRIFLRGRGLDAELGGELRLLGRLSNLAPAGAFNLIRGRLDILGKRFALDEALLQLEGNLLPFIRVRASTENAGITANILIEGQADDPTVSFTSVPELPEEEVIAQLLFGQGLQNLSALQALQLTGAVATLAGRGGDGIMNRLRQGVGLDNLDVKTNAEGGAEVTAGKYIGKNIYSEVTVGENGNSQINLNLDLTDSITLRGRAGSDGNTGIGVFVEKDY